MRRMHLATEAACGFAGFIRRRSTDQTRGKLAKNSSPTRHSSSRSLARAAIRRTYRQPGARQQGGRSHNGRIGRAGVEAGPSAMPGARVVRRISLPKPSKRLLTIFSRPLYSSCIDRTECAGGKRLFFVTASTHVSTLQRIVFCGVFPEDGSHEPAVLGPWSNRRRCG
jgi:hypothetical protein